MKRPLVMLPAVLALAGCHYFEEVHVFERPAAAVVVAPTPVSIHLATFRAPAQEQDEWFRITRDYPEAGQYPPRLVAVPDLPYTRLYELYIDGVPGPQAASLCADMMTHGNYCAIQAVTVAPAIDAPVVAPPPPIMILPPADKPL